MKHLIKKILALFDLGTVKSIALKEYNYITNKSNIGLLIPFTKYVLVRKKVFIDFNKKINEGLTVDSLPSYSDLPKTPLLDWNPNKNDSGIVQSAQDYRHEIMGNKYTQSFRNKLVGNISVNHGRSYWRFNTMRQIRNSLPNVFKGKVIEIGAGTGLVSSQLSKFEEVDEIYSLDYDPYTVKKIMPLVQWALDAESNKIHRIIGSYNKMECDDNVFDTIVAVGAMHHSENLETTMSECFRVLKPGGRFIISDYALTGDLTQYEYSALMNKPLMETDAANLEKGEVSTGIKTNSSISEHGRPAYIYKAAAFKSGFNINSYIFDATLESGGRLTRIYRLFRETFNKNKFYNQCNDDRELGYDIYGNVKAFDMREKIYYPFYASDNPSLIKLILMGDLLVRPVYDNMVLVLEKPDIENIKVPYRYKGGDTFMLPVNKIYK